jgi:hypothetical protein
VYCAKTRVDKTRKDNAAIIGLNINEFPLKDIEFSVVMHEFAPASGTAVYSRCK